MPVLLGDARLVGAARGQLRRVPLRRRGGQGVRALPRPQEGPGQRLQGHRQGGVQKHLSVRLLQLQGRANRGSYYLTLVHKFLSFFMTELVL